MGRVEVLIGLPFKPRPGEEQPASWIHEKIDGPTNIRINNGILILDPDRNDLRTIFYLAESFSRQEVLNCCFKSWQGLPGEGTDFFFRTPGSDNTIFSGSEPAEKESGISICREQILTRLFLYLNQGTINILRPLLQAFSIYQNTRGANILSEVENPLRKIGINKTDLPCLGCEYFSSQCRPKLVADRVKAYVIPNPGI